MAETTEAAATKVANDADALIMVFAPLVQGMAGGIWLAAALIPAIVIGAFLLTWWRKPSGLFAGGRRSREAMIAATERQAKAEAEAAAVRAANAPR